MTPPSLQIARRTDAGKAPGTDASPYPGALLAVAACAVPAHALTPALVGSQAVAVVLATYLAGATVAVLGLSRGYPHGEFGAANTVTLLRLSLVSVLVGALAGDGNGGWAVPAVATVALSLDGVDGWLARRSGLTSRYGARFDMEVDCALALVLALLLFESGKVGAWVLALGLARYAFWAASLALPWLAGALPARRSRKAACVAQTVALIAALSPHTAAPMAATLAAAASVIVGWSFAVDVRYLHRSRP